MKTLNFTYTGVRGKPVQQLWLYAADLISSTKDVTCA